MKKYANGYFFPLKLKKIYSIKDDFYPSIYLLFYLVHFRTTILQGS